MRLLFAVIICCATFNTASAQFFKGWGIMAGITPARQQWKGPLAEPGKHKFLIRYNAEVFGEFGDHPTFRWVTELQYNGKGDRFKTEAGTTKFKNDYFAWNNYLMIRKELFAVIPYVKVGPRLEYVWRTAQNFNTLHITGSTGAGVEFVAYGPVKFLTEMHWVPDITRSTNSDVLKIRQNAWELRVGIKFAFKGGSEACPPVYK